MKILYIDRNNYSFDAVKSLERDWNPHRVEAEILGAFSITSAREILQKYSFDLIFVNGMSLVDLHPDVYGLIELCKTKHSKNKIVPISSVSGITEELIEAGCKYPNPPKDKLKGVMDIIKSELQAHSGN
jgi:hypothetical protein